MLLPLVETFSRQGGLVLDPFAGSGSTLLAARQLGRRYFGIELDANYHAIASRRLEGEGISFASIRHDKNFEHGSIMPYDTIPHCTGAL